MPLSEKPNTSASYPVDEIRAVFARYNALVEKLDWDSAIELFTEDAEGGNAEFGVFPNKREGIRQFMAHNPTDWGYSCLWNCVDGANVRYKWSHWFPGERPDGSRYLVHGYAELHYAGNGRFDWLYSFPDLASYRKVKKEWELDRGQPYVSEQLHIAD